MKKINYFMVILFFLSLFLSVVISYPVLADDDGVNILKKEDMENFEKITFYETDKSNMIDCDMGGVSTSSVGGYEFLTKQVLMPTDSGSIRVEYGQIGKYKDREISAVVTYSDFEKKDSSYGQRDGRYLAIPYSFTNISFYDGDSLTEDVVFYYSDDPEKTPIDMTNAYLVINELNIDEYAGAKSGQKLYKAENSRLHSKIEGGIVCCGNGVLSKDDYSIENADDHRYQEEGIYYYDDPENPLYHINSVLFELKGDHNSFYIEDKRRGGGFGIKWALELNTLNIRYNINTHVVNGTITPSENGIKYDSDRTISYQPSEGYELESITVDGEEKDIKTYTDEYTFDHIYEDHEITVVYRPPYRSVLTEVINGTISPSENMIPSGSDKKIDYTPNEGYILDKIEVDEKETDITENRNSYVFSDIRTDHKIKVTYTKPDEPVKKVEDNNGNDINGNYVSVGDILTYKITYKNTLSRKSNIEITDTIPEGTEFYSVEGGTLSGNKVIWKLNTDPYEEGYVRMKVKVSDGSKGKNISNYAIQTIDDQTIMSNTVSNLIPEDPKKTVTDLNGKDINNTFITTGQEFIYKISLKNISKQSEMFEIRDKIPSGLEFISADNGGKNSKGEVIWNINIGPEEEKDVSFKVKAVSEGVTCSNQARVTVNGIKSVTNKVENWILEKPKKDVKQNGISVEGHSISPGEQITYQILVKNPSTGYADIRITDEISDYLEVKNIQDGGKMENDRIVWDLKKIKAKESVTVSFTATVKEDDEEHTIENTAEISIGNNNLKTNKTTIKVPAVKILKVLGERKAPVYVSGNTAGVLGVRDVKTGDRSLIIVMILLAMCAAAGIEFIKIRRLK